MFQAIPAEHDSISVPIAIRVASDADRHALEWLGAHADQRGMVRAAFERQRAGDYCILVADAGSFPVAQIWIDFAKLRAERVSVLCALRVFAPLRGMGLGTKLIRRAEALAASRGSIACELGVELGNGRALRLYRRLGYSYYELRRERYALIDRPEANNPRTVDMIVLRRTLTGDGPKNRSNSAGVRRAIRS